MYAYTIYILIDGRAAQYISSTVPFFCNLRAMDDTSNIYRLQLFSYLAFYIWILAFVKKQYMYSVIYIYNLYMYILYIYYILHIYVGVDRIF